MTVTVSAGVRLAAARRVRGRPASALRWPATERRRIFSIRSKIVLAFLLAHRVAEDLAEQADVLEKGLLLFRLVLLAIRHFSAPLQRKRSYHKVVSSRLA